MVIGVKSHETYEIKPQKNPKSVIETVYCYGDFASGFE